MKRSERISKIIAITIFALLLSIWTLCVNAQTKNDSILYNEYRAYMEYSRLQHKERVLNLEDEKYQMVYVDKFLIDREHHKIYMFSSYDLYWGEEIGLGYQFYFRRKTKIRKTTTNPPHSAPSPLKPKSAEWFEKGLNYNYRKDNK